MVIVATFPRSGTHWVCQIVHQFLDGSNYHHIQDVVGWLEMPGVDSNVKKIYKTHLPWAQIPYSIKEKYIVVNREPSEVILSAYRFAYQGTLDEAINEFVAGYFPNGVSWVNQVESYWNVRNLPNVLYLSYRELPALEKISKFLEVPIKGEEFIKFEYMKSIENRFKISFIDKPVIDGDHSLVLNTKQRLKIEALLSQLPQELVATL